MAAFQYPNAAVLVSALAIQTPYATGKVALAKAALPLSPTIAEADCAALEANYTGYAKKTLASLPAPYLDTSRGGASFTVPTEDFAVGATPTVFNDIYGGWMEDSTGVLLIAFNFLTPYPMQSAGDALNLEITLNFFGNGGVGITINGNPS